MLIGVLVSGVSANGRCFISIYLDAAAMLISLRGCYYVSLLLEGCAERFFRSLMLEWSDIVVLW